jgi:hypothetical protein
MNQDYWQTVGVTGYAQFSVPESEGEVNTMPDMAIPDHNLTLRELVERYSRGLPIDGMRTPIYDGEDEFIPDPRTLDLAEREQYAVYATEEIKKIRGRKQQPAAEAAGPKAQPAEDAGERSGL